MLDKIIVHGDDRSAALAKMTDALDLTEVWGVETNLAYLSQILRGDAFRSCTATTATLKDFSFRSRSIEVLAPGAQSSLQDWPGRLGYWDVGIPPSGPMDERSHRLV